MLDPERYYVDTERCDKMGFQGVQSTCGVRQQVRVIYRKAGSFMRMLNPVNLAVGCRKLR